MRTKTLVHWFAASSIALACLCYALASPDTCSAAPQAHARAAKVKPKKIKAFKTIKVLVVSPRRAATRSLGQKPRTSGAQNGLYFISAGGVMKEVSYTDDKGKPYKMQENPVAVYPVNDTYLMVAFGSDASNIYDALLVRKTDGALFSLKAAGWPVPTLNYFKNDRAVKTDAAGNIYYPTMKCSGNCTFSLVKVSVSNPKKLTAVKFTPPDDSIQGWDIDDLGDVIYYASVAGDGSNQVFRVKKAGGALENVTAWNGGLSFWRGYDSAFYFWSWTYGNYKRLTLDASGLMTREDYSAAGVPMPGVPTQSYLLKFADRVLTARCPTGDVVEVNNPSATPRTVNGLGVATITSAGQSVRYYYLAGNDSNANGVLLKVDPLTDGVTSLVPPGKYSFYNIAVGADDTVTYNALRMSDGVKVYGKIDADGSDTLISANNTEAVDLEPIN